MAGGQRTFGRARPVGATVKRRRCCIRRAVRPQTMSEPETVSPILLRVHAGCRRCKVPAVVLNGVREVLAFGPRGLMPGLLLFGVIAVLLGSVLLYSQQIPACLKNSVSRPIRICIVSLGLPALGALLLMSFHWLPLRMLVCPACRRSLEFCFSRACPLQWQQRMHPTWKCMTCGYSLIGVSRKPVCPECGSPFPREWLAVTCTGEVPLEKQVHLLITDQEMDDA